MRHTKTRGCVVTASLILLLSVTGCGHSADRTNIGEADETPVFEPFPCEIVDAMSGQIIPGRQLTIQFLFKKPATQDSPEETIANVIWGSKSSARVEFVVPEQALQHPDRDNLVVQWGVSHPDYETLTSEERVRLGQILRDDPKSARNIFRRIKLNRRSDTTT